MRENVVVVGRELAHLCALLLDSVKIFIAGHLTDREFRVQQLLSAAASLDGLNAGDVNIPPLQGS